MEKSFEAFFNRIETLEERIATLEKEAAALKVEVSKQPKIERISLDGHKIYEKINQPATTHDICEEAQV